MAAAQCAVLLLLLARPVLAVASPAASPLLPPDHWAVEAVDRLDALGLVHGWMPAQKSVPVLAVAAALRTAEAETNANSPGLAATVARWRIRFDEEWPGAATGSPVLGVRVGVGAQAGDASEDATQPVRADPSALRLVDTPETSYAQAGAALRAGVHVAAAATVRVDDAGAALADGDVIVAAGWAAIAAGRSRPGFGFSRGGVMLSGVAIVDRIEILTTRPITMPGVLRRAGTWTANTFLARLRAPRHTGEPLLWGSSFRWRMHPRFTLGGQRAVMLGGDPWDGFPAGDRALALLGVANYRENNILGVSVRWRMPTEPLLPLTLDVDWGTDDDPLAAVKVPGVVAGVSTPMLGNLPVALGVEYGYFGRFCCREPQNSAPWYRHDLYPGGWAVGQTPLGDSLGGNGRALRLRATVEHGSNVRVTSSAWFHDRFPTNLYAPQAGGRSVGARVSAQLRFPRTTVELRGDHERAARWHTSSVGTAAMVFF